MQSYNLRRSLYATAAFVATSVIAGSALAQTEVASIVDEVIVTGTREAGRTQFDTLAPVDVLSGESIQAAATPPPVALTPMPRAPTHPPSPQPPSSGLSTRLRRLGGRRWDAL